MRQFLLIALVAAMLLFGCAGSSTPPANQPAQQQNQQAQPSGNGQQTVQQPSQPSGKTAADSFFEILGLEKTLQYKVAYDVTSKASGQQIAMQTTQYLKSTTKMRTDSAYGGIESRSYLVDNIFYSCSKQGTSWTCMKISASKDEASKTNEDIEANKQDYTITADGTMQIAGVTATCYKVSGKSIESYRACHSPEGVPLYLKMTSTSQGVSSEIEMKATSYSTSVSDADFVLPAQATELPSIPSGGNMGTGGSGGQLDCSFCGYFEPGADKDACLASCSS